MTVQKDEFVWLPAPSRVIMDSKALVLSVSRKGFVQLSPALRERIKARGSLIVGMNVARRQIGFRHDPANGYIGPARQSTLLKRMFGEAKLPSGVYTLEESQLPGVDLMINLPRKGGTA